MVPFFCCFCFFLFLIGFLGIFCLRRNLLIIIMSLEIMLLAINLNFIFSSIFFDIFDSQVFSLFLLGIAGVESVIGLVIFIIYFKIRSF